MAIKFLFILVSCFGPTDCKVEVAARNQVLFRPAILSRQGELQNAARDVANEVQRPRQSCLLRLEVMKGVLKDEIPHLFMDSGFLMHGNEQTVPIVHRKPVEDCAKVPGGSPNLIGRSFIRGVGEHGAREPQP